MSPVYGKEPYVAHGLEDIGSRDLILYDPKTGASQQFTYNGKPIKVIVNNEQVRLAPGTELLLTHNQSADFETLNPTDKIGYRNVRTKDMGNDVKAFVADFSLVAALTSVKSVRQILKSDKVEHIQVSHKMLKNAAILADLTSGVGEYKTIPPKQKPVAPPPQPNPTL